MFPGTRLTDKNEAAMCAEQQHHLWSGKCQCASGIPEQNLWHSLRNLYLEGVPVPDDLKIVFI